jgi:tRNA (guanine-N7-)-methyltransferase
MKPKDLRSPFARGEKMRFLLQDGVLYLPKLVCEESAFSFPGFSSSECFGNDNPICIEYCSGNGNWIVERAQQMPHKNWVAVEMKFKRVQKIWSKKQNHHLHNLFIFCGEALEATRRFINDASVEEVYVNFPDPWPKKRHAKNRLIQEPFISEVQRILKPSGSLTLVTDDIPYSEQMIETVLAEKSFSSRCPAPYYQLNPENYGASYFDTLWREKGKDIRFHQFIKEHIDAA